MRDSWELKNIGSICSTYAGGTPNRSKREYYNGEIPWVSSGEVNQPFIYNTKEKITESGLKYSSAKKIPSEAILLAMYGATAGQVSKLKLEATSNQAVLALIPIDADDYFIYHELNFIKRKILYLAQGSGQPNLSKALIDNTYIKFPPLPQQKKIAEILSTCDTVIAQTEAAIAKYEALKQGLMHDLFTRGIDVNTGKLRPTYQEAPELYKETELGFMPMEWEVGKFIDFADPRINRSFTGGPFGSDLQTKHYTKEGVRIIQLQNIGDGHFKNDYKIYTSEERANYLIACNIYPGEIILSKMAEPIARACIIPSYSERYLMASDGIRLSIDKRNYNTRFVLETINQKRFRSIAEVRSTGTTRSRIGLTELKEIPVSYPNLKEQNLIGQRLDTLMRKIEDEQKSLEKYQKLKAGLMQDLLSGAVGVEELVDA